MQHNPFSYNAYPVPVAKRNRCRVVSIDSEPNFTDLNLDSDFPSYYSFTDF